jgi:flagellar protein FliJ
MASHQSLVRLKDFQIRQHRRTIDQLHFMIADIELLAQNLDREIRAEEDRTKMHDPAHFAYPTFAKAAIQRRENLRQSADRLKIHLAAANKALSEAIEESEAIALPDVGNQPPNRFESSGQSDGLNRAS